MYVYIPVLVAGEVTVFSDAYILIDGFLQTYIADLLFHLCLIPQYEDLNTKIESLSCADDVANFLIISYIPRNIPTGRNSEARTFVI